MDRRWIVAALCSACTCLPVAAQSGAASPHAHPHAQHRFTDAERWARVFDDPQRDAWQQPERVLDALGLPADAVVADIGAGTGYFAVRLARRVPTGRVYAVDIEPEMVRHLGERARREGLAQVEPIAGAPDDPRLPGKVDLALVVDTYHHIEARTRYFERLRARLAPDARVAIVDFRLDSRHGPPPAARIAPAQVIRELQAAGYRLDAQHDFLPDQYFLVFRPGS